MRALLIFSLTLGFFVTTYAADVVTGRVVKMLPLLLDQQGRTALSPSLFDRDAYQLRLHTQTNLVSAIRYDVQWSAKNIGDNKLTIRLELRGTGTNNMPKLKTFEADAVPGTIENWTKLTLAGDDYKSFGTITAWRATLWNGEQLLGEDKSFLW